MNEILYVYKYLNKNNKEYLNELKRSNIPIFVEIEQLILSKTFTFEKEKVKRVITHKKKLKTYEENIQREISEIFNKELETQKAQLFEYKTPFGLSKYPLIEYLYLFFTQKEEIKREIKVNYSQFLTYANELVKWYELQKGYDPIEFAQNTTKNPQRLPSLNVPLPMAIDTLFYALLQFYLGEKYLTSDGNIDLTKFTFYKYKIDLDRANYYSLSFSSPNALSQQILEEINIAKQYLYKLEQNEKVKQEVSEQLATSQSKNFNIEGVYPYFSPLQRQIYQDYTQKEILEQDYEKLKQINKIKVITQVSMNKTFDIFTKEPNDLTPTLIFQANNIFKIEVALKVYHQFLDEFNYKEEDYFFNKIKKQLNFYIPPQDNFQNQERVA